MTLFIPSLDKNKLAKYISHQLNTFYPDGQNEHVAKQLDKVLEYALERARRCFGKVKSKYYKKGENVFFNHLNGDHYCMFLYLLSNSMWKLTGDENTAAKLFLLNKAMFGIDAFYQIELPEVFLFIHPTGSVLGKAKYNKFLVVYQGVTIGSKIDGVYPEFGDRTILYSNSSVIGECKLGNNCIVAANSFLLNSSIGDNKVITGSYPQNKISENKNKTIEYYFELK